MLALWIRVAGAQQQAPQQQAQQQDVVLVPHRATYDMKLSVARPNSGIVEVNGRMVLEMVDSCDAWEVKQRIKLKFLRNDGEEFDTDSSFTSYETKDGLQLRFSVRNIQDQEVEEELRGHADLEATGGKGRAAFSLPEVRSFDLPARACLMIRARWVVGKSVPAGNSKFRTSGSVKEAVPLAPVASRSALPRSSSSTSSSWMLRTLKRSARPSLDS